MSQPCSRELYIGDATYYCTLDQHPDDTSHQFLIREGDVVLVNESRAELAKLRRLVREYFEANDNGDISYDDWRVAKAALREAVKEVDHAA